MKTRWPRAGCVIALMVVFLGGCGATRYRRHTGWKGGYVDARLSEDTFKVSFAGNSLTAGATAEIYLMYRCAELTAGAGYDYFQIVKTVGRWTPWPAETLAVSSETAPWWDWAPDHEEQHGGGEHGAIIKVSKGERPQAAYDAKQLIRFLGPTIRR